MSMDGITIKNACDIFQATAKRRGRCWYAALTIGVTLFYLFALPANAQRTEICPMIARELTQTKLEMATLVANNKAVHVAILGCSALANDDDGVGRAVACIALACLFVPGVDNCPEVGLQWAVLLSRISEISKRQQAYGCV